MSREVCGICWCPYDEDTGECACKVPSDCADSHQPVAWLFTHVQSGESDFCFCADEHDHDREMWHRQPLYTSHLKCKPLTEEEIEKAYREIWRNLPSEFDHTSSGWIELGIRYAERAHGIGD